MESVGRCSFDAERYATTSPIHTETVHGTLPEHGLKLAVVTVREGAADALAKWAGGLGS